MVSGTDVKLSGRNAVFENFDQKFDEFRFGSNPIHPLAEHLFLRIKMSVLGPLGAFKWEGAAAGGGWVFFGPHSRNDILELEMKEQNKDKKSSDLQEQLEAIQREKKELAMEPVAVPRNT